jgi:hypothetical protein
MQRAVVLLGVGALLAACASPPPGPATPTLVAMNTPVAGRAPDPCDLLLDPFTKNTDLVELFYRLDRGILRPEAGGERVVITLPLTHTYDAEKGIAHIPTDPLQGDSIFFDAAAARGAANTLATYTLVTDPTSPINKGSYPAADTLGPPTQPRVSMGLRYGVALLDLDPRGGASGTNWASAKDGMDVPLAPARAKKVSSRLSVKIVADLVTPGVLTGTEVHRATEKTGAWEVDLRYVAGRTVCAAVVTASDGEMVKRLK